MLNGMTHVCPLLKHTVVREHKLCSISTRISTHCPFTLYTQYISTLRLQKKIIMISYETEQYVCFFFVKAVQLYHVLAKFHHWCITVSITVYDRHTLLNIGSSVAQRKPDFEFLNAGTFFYRHRIRVFCLGHTVAGRGNADGKGGREPASLSDSEAVPSDLLSQPFSWLTFSHWTTNSVNCGRASLTNKK